MKVAAPVNGASRWFARATLLVVVLLFTVRSGHLAAGIPAAALVVGSGFWRRGLSVNRAGQLLLGLLGLALAWPAYLALSDIAGGKQTLGTAGTVVTLFALLVTLPRQFFASPHLGPKGDAALNLLAVMGCAHTSRFLIQAPTSWTYLLFVGLYVVLQLLTLRSFDPTRPAPGLLSGRHRLVVALMVAIIVGVGMVGTLAIPPAHYWAMRKAYFTFMRVQTGFSKELQLGSVDSMYQSDKLVLRVHGPKPDHLRGFVYRHYQGGGQWTAGPRSPLLGVKLQPAAPVDAGGLTRVETVGGDARRYFVPLAARDLRAAEALARVNALGIIRTAPGEEAEQIQFRAGTRVRFAVAPPGDLDTAAPSMLRPLLQRLARRWAAGAKDPRARLLAIEHRLRSDFTYSLSFSRLPGRDPVMDFLTRDRQGHCEYFASAMALLARSSGVPARVVSGYLVHERNPLGGHYVVRERNAHSWVEAWVGGSWQTFDPTPSGATAASEGEMGFAAALWDLVAARLGQAWRWITSLTAYHVAGAVGALFVVWVLLRLLRRRRERGAAGQAHALAYGRSLPGLGRLLSALSSTGPPRGSHEPLETYARRLAGEPRLGAPGEQASALLNRYAAWRYGGVGDAGTLDRLMEALAAELQGTRGAARD